MVFMSYKPIENKSNSPLVSIIILNFNGGKILLDCINSVINTVNIEKEIILIDNGSDDNSHFICQKKFSEIILIQNKKNIGLAARNFGLEKATGRFIVFLDSDTIVQKNWLDILMESYKEHGEGLYQPKILEKNDPKIINSAGNMINIFGIGYSRGKSQKDVGQYNNFQKISYTSGACTLMTNETAAKIGKIDRIFFAYHDDLDFGWRAQLLGIPSFYEPKSIIHHLGSQTFMWSKKKFFYLERNRWICLLTLYSRKTLTKIFPLLIIFEIGMFFFFLLNGMGITKIQSLISLMGKNNEIKNKYNSVNKTRILSDIQVIKKFSDEVELPSAVLKNQSGKFFENSVRKLSKLGRRIINT